VGRRRNPALAGQKLTNWQRVTAQNGQVFELTEKCYRNFCQAAFGTHTAVGGESDYPVPGELLCAAVASCLDSTIRTIANRQCCSNR
jgi:hypothetical protein